MSIWNPLVIFAGNVKIKLPMKKKPKKAPAKTQGPVKKLDSGKVILTCDELLEVFPEPEEVLDQIEAAIDEGLIVVKDEEQKKSTEVKIILPEVSESEAVQESIAWYLNKIGEIPRFSLEEERKIGALALEGSSSAREKMIQANLRLVVFVAKKFKNKGVSFLDLIQAGNLGLIKAVKKFNPQKKLSFGIFAIPFIKDAIWKTVRKQGYLIKMPRDQAEKIKIVQKTRLELIQTRGRWPSGAEVASRAGLELEEVERIFKLDNSLISLDREIGVDGQRLIDQIKDESDFGKTEEIDEEINLAELLGKLSDLEQKVIGRLYGLKGSGLQKPEEVAAFLEISPEKILEIEKEALAKMRDFFNEEL